MHTHNHKSYPTFDLSLYPSSFIENLIQRSDWSSEIIPYPEIEPTKPPFDFPNQNFITDSFLSSVEPEPEVSINNFGDVGQIVQLVGDVSLVDSFDIFG